MTEAEIQERLKKLDPEKKARLAKLLGLGSDPDPDLLATVTALQKGHARVLKHLGITDDEPGTPPAPARPSSSSRRRSQPASGSDTDDDEETLVDGILKFLGVS